MRVEAPAGTYPHGHRAKYVLEGCRCDACRVANREANQRQARLKLYGRSGNVDAESARRHVRRLMATGMGYKRIGLAAGLDPKTIHVILRGRTERGTPPPRQIRRTTERKILAVRPLVTGGQIIPALDTWEFIADIMALGYSKCWIAEQLGHKHALQLGKTYIKAYNARAIRRLWEQAVEPRTPIGRYDASTISRCKNQSRKLRHDLHARRQHLERKRERIEQFDRRGQGATRCL